jgi:hypothetical protein
LANTKIGVPESIPVYLVITGKCSDLLEDSPCESNDLGEVCFNECHSFAIGSRHRWNIGSQLADCFDWPELFASERKARTCDGILKYEKDGFITNDSWPIATAYIYCPPCVCQVQTALRICRGVGVPLSLDFRIRIDERLPSSCYEGPQALGRLTSLDRRITDILENSHPKDPSKIRDINNIDRPWLEQRIFKLEEETAGSSRSEDPFGTLSDIFASSGDKILASAAVIILGEVDYCTLVLEDIFKFKSARKPREADLWELRPVWDIAIQGEKWERKYLGTYTRRQRPNPIQHPASSWPV